MPPSEHDVEKQKFEIEGKDLNSGEYVINSRIKCDGRAGGLNVNTLHSQDIPGQRGGKR